MLFAADKYNYPDDIFDESRMSFGDHIEELRSRLIKALKGLGLVLFLGFLLDYCGDQFKQPWLGVGRPMMGVIVDPVESQVRDFYNRRNQKNQTKLDAITKVDPAEVERVRAKLAEYDGQLSVLSTDEKKILLSAPRSMPVVLPVEPLAKVFGPPKDPNVKEIELTMQVFPAHLHYLGNEGEGLLENRQYLTSLSVQEAFMVYFKVSLLCGVVLSCPWIFFQIWAFVAAGLYPHEKKIVWNSLPYAVGLFLVLPGAVKALLAFNNWIGVDPDLRLNEWLAFALILPLVFGLSFQTPLVMVILNRIGLFGWEDYARRWRGAIMILAVFSALITPTPDALTMLYLFLPMFGLYLLGILICKWYPPPARDDDDESDDGSQVAV
jgi:sec-independent protein translocase protein TatC